MNNLSVVVPAYNEEERLPLSIEKTVNYLETNNIDYELIVVCDGSLDKTEVIVKDLAAQNKKIKLLINDKNMGKGYSVRRGILSSTRDCILFMDADNSTSISELQKFTRYLIEYDVIIGSRALPESIIIKRQKLAREYTGKLFNFVIQLFFLSGIKDTQCGFKLFKRKAALDIFKRSKVNRFVFDVEILYIAKKLGYKIMEVPITWSNSKPSKVSFFKDSLNIIFDLLMIKWRELKAIQGT